MRDLPEIREDINSIDAQLRTLFQHRMDLALEVANAKQQTNDAILKPEREKEILESWSDGMPPERRTKYQALQRSLMRSSREIQYAQILRLEPAKFPFHASCQPLTPQSVYYQGVLGAYQELAARALFPNSAPQNVATWEQVFSAVHRGTADVGVVPVENTTAGTVSEVYDLLLDYDLFINRSYIKTIHHCLAAVPGATLKDIRRVCSHPHALPQCHEFISTHDLEAIEVSNTAIAAQNVQRQQDTSLAAICSEEAAARYGLSVLATNINDLKHNETRFIAVSRVLTCQPDDNRIEIAFHIPNEAGSLSSVLNIFADYAIDMTEIHSRPKKDSPWCYVFYVDFTGNMAEQSVRALLYQLHEELPFLKVIGSYRV